MTCSNLAVVFQPGLVSTRETASSGALLGFPGFGGQVPVAGTSSSSNGAREGAEHGRAKEVLEFLIENQAHFVLGSEEPVSKEGDEYSQGVSSSSKGLERSGSERSTGERRRLRKPHDGLNGKVKRTRTSSDKTDNREYDFISVIQSMS